MTIFAQMSAQGVDCLGPLSDQQRPDAKDAGRALRFLGLDRDKTHARTLCRLANRLGIVRIVFLTFDERLHIGGRNEPDVMARLDQFPRPEMRASASFHRHQTRRQRREESQHLRAPQLLSEHGGAASISAVGLIYILRQIESDNGNLRHDRLPEWSVAIPPWHVDAVGGGYIINANLWITSRRSDG